MHKEKMKQLNSEIKLIKEKLAKNQDRAKRKDSDNIIIKSRFLSKGNDNPHVFES